MKRIALALATAAAIGCTEAPPHTPADADGYTVALRSPERVSYAPALLGTGPTPLEVVIVNRASTPLDVSNVALRLEAAHGGVLRECRDPGLPRNAEPAVLRPGESHTYERALDCRLPLAGRYRVTVSVAFGADRTWRSVRTYDLEVSEPPGLEARPLNDAGLVATIGAPPVAGSSSKEAHPRAGIALVNTGMVPLELPPLRVETRVRHVNAPWTCTSRAKALATPAALGGGAVHREPFDVACLGFDAPGTYDVEVVLWMGADREVSLGHLRIAIEEDPARLRHAPYP